MPVLTLIWLPFAGKPGARFLGHRASSPGKSKVQEGSGGRGWEELWVDYAREPHS